ncbi:MAG: hypothetical protein F4Y45_02870 [Acidobacteria bacterium]|nr:hypothetical protein [Acidobacteriota bacterium]MYD70250.1 hypothetical protein [Acidobacteriota bacterium]MYJ05839.1 hypothetical protein [Acidobacteriota bacterium]
MTDPHRLTLPGILARAAVVHTVTYFFAGVLAFTLFDYGTALAEPPLDGLMRSPDDPMVMAGPLFQPVRGLLFGAVFYLLRDQYFGRQYGWLTMWVVLVVIGTFSTFGPAPGSIEGLIYTTLPLSVQLGVGHIETAGQALALSGLLFYWVRYPKRWLTWSLVGVFMIVMVLPTLGLLLG